MYAHIVSKSEPRWLNDTQQQAWRALMVLAARGFPRLDRTLKQHGLLMVHYSILVSLSEAPDRTLRLSELADASNLSQSRLTHRLRTLVDRGDVAIEASCDDGRGKNAKLTAAGLERLQSIAPVHAEDVQQLIFDHLDAEQTKALADTMSTVAANLCGHDHFVTTESGDAQAESAVHDVHA